MDSDQSVDSSPRHSTSDSELKNQPEEKRLIGDFDVSANTLWTLYGKEAKSYDDARINTLKDDMDGVLIFVRPYSIHTYDSVILMCDPIGWFIFCCPYSVCE